MQTSIRGFRGCGTTLTHRGAQALSTSPPPIRACPIIHEQPLVSSFFASERRQHRSVLLAAQKSDVSSSSAASVRSKKSAAKEGSAPLPIHEDDILLVPAAHMHIEQLERHDIYTLSDFRRTYEKEKPNFRRFLQDKIQIRDRTQLDAMEAFFRMTDMGQQQQQQRNPAAVQAGPAAAAAAEGSVVAAAAVPLGMTSEQVTLSLEGNISAGKTTFLSILERYLFAQGGYTFVAEPIAQWQSVGGPSASSGVNLLEMFYRDPRRMAYIFQNFVFLTRVLQERETYGTTTKARILERSVFSDRMVFVRAVHASRDLEDHELAVYDAWFGPLLASLPTLVPNGLIYLRASPETCLARLRRRARSEEGGIPLAYLQCLHNNHEDWLLRAGIRASELQQRLTQLQEAQTAEARRRSSADASTSSEASSSSSASLSSTSTSIKTTTGSTATDVQRERQRVPPMTALRPLMEAPPAALGCLEVPDSLADKLYIIDATKVSGVPPCGYLHQLPALVLDCDADVDVDGDTAYGKHVSGLVADYTAFVSAYRAACHRLAAERRAAAESVAGGPSPHSRGGCEVGRPLPHPATDYYTTDAVGRVRYRPVVPDVPGGVANGAASAAKSAT